MANALTDWMQLRMPARGDGLWDVPLNANFVDINARMADFGRSILGRKYSADPTGLTSSSAAIQAALNDGSIIIPPGTYLLTTLTSTPLGQYFLNVPSNRRVVLMPGATLLVGAENATFSTSLLFVNGASNVIIEGGGILDGNKATFPTASISGVSVTGASSKVALRDFTARNFSGSAVGGERQGDGVTIGGPTPAPMDVTVDNVTCDGNVRQGISITAGKRIKVTNCNLLNTAGNNPGRGIDVEPNNPTEELEDIIITNNIFSNNFNGGLIIGGAVGGRCVVSGNTFNGGSTSFSGGAGQHIFLNTFGADTTIIGNSFKNYVKQAIEVLRADGTTIIGNEIEGQPAESTQRNAILVSGLTSSINIIGNSIRDTAQHAILIDQQFNNAAVGTLRNVVILGNQFRDCYLAGAANAWVVNITSDSAASKLLSGITLAHNQFYDTRAGADVADFAYRVNVSAAELETFQLHNNTNVGCAALSNLAEQAMLTGYHELAEITDPAAAPANRGRLYVRDNGSGKSQLVVRFPTGAIQVVATEP